MGSKKPRAAPFAGIPWPSETEAQKKKIIIFIPKQITPAKQISVDEELAKMMGSGF